MRKEITIISIELHLPKKSGHRKNIEISPNPDPSRDTPMYIRFGKKLKYNIDIEIIGRKKD